MERDRLFLLRPDFEDPAYPGQRFYCWHCAPLKGLLASFPLFVERIAWPGCILVDFVGEDNQSIPLIVLADDAPADFATGTRDGKRVVSGKDAFLSVLN